ncbi:DUF2220 family protein [Cytophagaceae bacterium ABcell3]|nr:DUF2220 family protein [Cytophagaceae bacterium ABcell3]
MISPKEIKQKADRWWKDFLQHELCGTPYFPKDVPQIGLVSQNELINNFLSVSEQFRKLQESSKDHKGYGYSLEWSEKNFRSTGRNRFISRIFFETAEDYLRFTGSVQDFKAFAESVQKIRNSFPELEDWMKSNPLKVCTNAKQWDALLKVCYYFKHQHIPGKFYIRELPVNVHTKFIEENKALLSELLSVILPEDKIQQEYTAVKDFEKRFGLRYSESLVRVRILDEALAEQCFSGIMDISVTESAFNSLNLPCKRAFVFENKTNYSNLMNFLTLPMLKDSAGIFGSGFKVGLLKNAHWLHSRELLYWGDLDVQGFQILSQIRGYFPHTRSFLMDKATLEKFRHEALAGTETTQDTPLHLTSEEQEVYHLLKQDNLRLEQEKIPHGYVAEMILKLFEK